MLLRNISMMSLRSANGIVIIMLNRIEVKSDYGRYRRAIERGILYNATVKKEERSCRACHIIEMHALYECPLLPT